MSELKPLPCPFCGGIGAYQRDFHMCCQVCGAEGPDGDSSHESAAIEFWNRRAQPAQASNDGLVWREIERGADYIKMKGWVSGLPAQPLITSETGKAPDQGASAITSESGKAGQVLTDDDLWVLWNAQGCDDMNQSEAMSFARAIEQSVLAKRVPMTPEETDAAMKLLFYPARNRAFIDGVEAAELHHGIVGEKGGA